MKLKNIMFFIAVATMAIGCTEDESTGMQTKIPDIEIGDFAEEGYSVVSYEGNYLNLIWFANGILLTFRRKTTWQRKIMCMNVNT